MVTYVPPTIHIVDVLKLQPNYSFPQTEFQNICQKVLRMIIYRNLLFKIAACVSPTYSFFSDPKIYRLSEPKIFQQRLLHFTSEPKQRT